MTVVSAIAEKFKEFGLSEAESQLISVVLEKGIIPTLILSESIDIPRNEVTSIINSLESKNLVAEVDGYIIALPPISFFAEKIYSVLTEVKKLSDSLKKELIGKVQALTEEHKKTVFNENMAKMKTLINGLRGEVENVKEKLIGHTEAIGEYLGSTSTIVKTYRDYLEKLEELLKKYSSELDRMKVTIVFKEETWEKIGEKTREQIKELLSQYYPLIEKIDTLYRELTELIGKTRENIIKIHQDVVSKLELTIKAIEKEIPEVINIVLESIPKALKEFYTEFGELVKKIGNELLINFKSQKEMTYSILESTKKDIKEGYLSIVDSVYRGVERQVNNLADQLMEVIKEAREISTNKLRGRVEVVKKEKERITTTFGEEKTRIETVPVAYDKAIQTATTTITNRFYDIFNERIEKLKELENETWVWLSEKIIETADKIVETTDTLRNGYANLLKDISTNLGILEEYILDLPNKIYKTLDREWRSFLSESLNSFKNFMSQVEKQIESKNEETKESINQILDNISEAIIKTDENDKVILMETINASYQKTGSSLNKVIDDLKRIREELTKRSGSREIVEEINDIVQLIEAILKNDLEFLREEVERFIEARYSKRASIFNEHVNKLKELISNSINKTSSGLIGALSSIQDSYINNLDVLMETVKLIYGNQLEAFNKLVSSMIKNTTEKANNTFDSAMKIVTKHSDEMVKIFRDITGEIKERIDSFLVEFTGELNGLPEAYNKAIQEVSDETKKMLTQISENMSSVISKSEERLSACIEKVEETMLNITDLINNNLSKIEENIGTFKEGVKSEAKRNIEEGGALVNEYVDNIIKDTINSLRRNLDEIEETIIRATELLGEKLVEKLQAHGSAAEENLNKKIASYVEEVKASLENLKKEEKELKVLFDELSQRVSQDQNIENISEILEQIRTQIGVLSGQILNVVRELITTQILGRVDQYIDTVKEHFKEIETALEGSKEQIIGAAETIESFDHSEIKDRIGKIEKQANSIIGLFQKGLENYNGMTSAILEHLQSTSEEKISDLTGALDRLFETINSYYLFIATFGDRYEETLKNLLGKARVINDSEVAKKYIDELLSEGAKKITLLIVPKASTKQNNLQIRELNRNLSIISTKDVTRSISKTKTNAAYIESMLDKKYRTLLIVNNSKAIIPFKELTVLKLIDIDSDALINIINERIIKKG